MPELHKMLSLNLEQEILLQTSSNSKLITFPRLQIEKTFHQDSAENGLWHHLRADKEGRQ